MREDGIIKALQGITTLEEVESATADTSKDKTFEPVEEKKEKQ